MARRQPTEDDRQAASRFALGGLAADRDLGDILRDLWPLHPKNNTFPGEVFLELAADALDLADVNRARPLQYEGIRERYLPEVEFRGRADHQHSHYALRAVAMLRAGLEPDLLDEVSWWSSDDFWTFAFYALVIYLRAAANRTGEPINRLCNEIAARHGIELAAH